MFPDHKTNFQLQHKIHVIILHSMQFEPILYIDFVETLRPGTFAYLGCKSIIFAVKISGIPVQSIN
jgi:hypothetical protein